jgi:hypothetical protein
MTRVLKSWLSVAGIGLALAWAPGAKAQDQTQAMPEKHMAPAPNAGFDQMKALVGEWEFDGPEGAKMVTSYKLVSGGTAIEERLQPGNEPEMVTMYTADGNRMSVTHFCSSNTQPHMETGPITGATKSMDFQFVSATNLATPETGHMQRLVVNFEDPNHMTETWTWRENGKEGSKVMHFTRKS